MATDNQSARPADGFRLPSCSLALGIIALSAYFIAGAAPHILVFDREAIAGGELWRLIPGHWVHSNRARAAWNNGALLLIRALFEKNLRWQQAAALLCGTRAVVA